MSAIMNTTMKFKAGTFIELDDMHGGRRVALICRDGITCIDSMNVDESTPLFLHPVFDPVALGTLMEFVAARDMRHALSVAMDYSLNNDPVLPDALMLFQRLWFLSSYGIKGDMTPSLELLNQAASDANAQRDRALAIHHYASRYVETKSKKL